MEVVKQIKAITNVLAAFKHHEFTGQSGNGRQCDLARDAGHDFVRRDDFERGRFATVDCIACLRKFDVGDKNVNIRSLGLGARSMFALCEACEGVAD